MDAREQRGQELAKTGSIMSVGKVWTVSSQTAKGGSRGSPSIDAMCRETMR